jgi:hypothetical protein
MDLIDSTPLVTLLSPNVERISLQFQVSGFKMRSLVRRSPVGLAGSDQQGPQLSVLKWGLILEISNFLID